jgi:hypothetical protein
VKCRYCASAKNHPTLQNMRLPLINPSRTKSYTCRMHEELYLYRLRERGAQWVNANFVIRCNSGQTEVKLARQAVKSISGMGNIHFFKIILIVYFTVLTTV